MKTIMKALKWSVIAMFTAMLIVSCNDDTDGGDDTSSLATPTGLALNGDPSDISFSVNWNAVDGASSYVLSYTDGTMVDSVENILTDGYMLTGLNAETTYDVKVKAVNSTVSSAYSEVLSVTTAALNMSAYKRGACNTFSSTDWSFYLSNLKVHWFYSWGPWNIDVETLSPDNLEFVPMFFGKATNQSMADEIKEQVDAGVVKHVLGFNEPDGEEQANMTVDEAIALWPIIESTGARIGAPAVAKNADVDGEWLDEFMTKAKAQNLQVDFIPVHWYGGLGGAQNLITYIQNVHEKYGLPVWLTEFAPANWNATPENAPDVCPTAGELNSFMLSVLPRLDTLQCLERYSWFSGGPDFNALYYTNLNSLLSTTGELSGLGQTYSTHMPNDIIGEGKERERADVIIDADNIILNAGFEAEEFRNNIGKDGQNVFNNWLAEEQEMYPDFYNNWNNFVMSFPWDGGKSEAVGFASTVPYEGNFCARVEAYDGSIHQAFTPEAGKTYSVEFYQKWSQVTDGAEQISVTIQYVKKVDKSGNGSATKPANWQIWGKDGEKPDVGIAQTIPLPLASEVDATVWKKVSSSFTVPSDVTFDDDNRMRFNIWIGKTSPRMGSLFLDNLIIKEVTE